MSVLHEVLLGAAVVLGPIWLSCLFGAVCWAAKRVVLWIRCRREAAKR